MSDYPTDEEVLKFLGSSVSPPALEQFQQMGTAYNMPLRKIIGMYVESAAATFAVAQHLRPRICEGCGQEIDPGGVEHTFCFSGDKL